VQEEMLIHSSTAQVAGRLDALGVAAEVLGNACHYGLQHAFQCTRHDPPMLPGVLAWGKTMRYLRDQLVPLGWTVSNARNYATVVHPQGGLAITVAAGDANTGLSDAVPSTKHEKGPATRDAVRQNQLTFADVSESFPVPTRDDLGSLTWLLLHYADEEREEIRMELSLPQDMTADGYVTTWRERILLPSVPFSPTPEEAGDEDEPEIDISVERRAN
jgi:hypothetical protein